MSTPQRDGRLRRSRGTPRIIAAAILAVHLMIGGFLALNELISDSAG